MRSIRLFLAFCVGLSIAFNTQKIGSVSVVQMCSILYIIFLLPLFLKQNLLSKLYGKNIYLLVVYYILLVVINFLHKQEVDVPIFSKTFLLNIFLFFALLIHSSNDKRVPVFSICGFTFGAVILSILFLNGIGLTISPYNLRISIFDMNPNDLGLYMCIAIIFIFSFIIYENRLDLKWTRFLFILPIISMGIVIVGTASRSAILVLLLSVSIGLLLIPSKHKVLILFVGIILLTSFICHFLHSDLIVAERMLTSIEDGNTAGRTDIWKALLPYGMQHPLLGVGETGYAKISKMALSYDNYDTGFGFSPHNALIEVFMYSGLLGLTIMLIFWSNVFMRAYRQLINNQYMTPILLCVPLLMALLSGQVLHPRHLYLIYVYCIVNNFKIENQQLA